MTDEDLAAITAYLNQHRHTIRTETRALHPATTHQLPPTATRKQPRLCTTCGHTEDRHTHLRPGDDCGCGCPHYRSRRRPTADELIAAALIITGCLVWSVTAWWIIR